MAKVSKPPIVVPMHIWTEGEKRAFAIVRDELNAAHASAFDFICANQNVDGSDRIILNPELVKTAGRISDKQLTELRERVAYHSARLPDCQFVLVIGHKNCRLQIIPKGVNQLRLMDLETRERLDNGGHLVPSSEIIIYIHQATGLPDTLLEQMLINMRRGITYRYFIPLAYSMHILDIIMELFGDEPNEETLNRLEEGFQVNIVAESVPVFFSIHNATNEERAIMFVRSPGSSSPKYLIKYGDNRWANQQYQQLMRLWNPLPRTSNCPTIVLPCKDVTPVVDLHRDLGRRLRARDVEERLIEKIIRLVLGDSATG